MMLGQTRLSQYLTGKNESLWCKITFPGKATMRVLRIVLGMLLALNGLARAQKIDEHDRADAREMLRLVAEDVRKNYYDPKLLAEFESPRGRQRTQRSSQQPFLDRPSP